MSSFCPRDFQMDATANGLVGDSSGNNCRAITGPPLLPLETLFFVSSWKRWGSKGLNLRDFNVLLETIAQRRRIVRNGSGIIVGDILHKGERVYQRDENIFGRRAEEGVATDFKRRAQWPRTEGGRSLWRIVIEMKTGCYLAMLGTMAVLEYSSGRGKMEIYRESDLSFEIHWFIFFFFFRILRAIVQK